MAQPSSPAAATNGAPPTSPGLAPSNTAAGTKRKRTGERKFYAVREGRKPGIYDTWHECLLQVRGHKGSLFKAFQSLHEAQAFIDGKLLSSPNGKNPGEQKYYAVQNGRVPGVYTDWYSAQAQIRGIRNPKHRKFSTRAEAEAFVAAGKKQTGLDPTENISPEEEIRRLIVRNSAPGLQVQGTYSPRDKEGNPYSPGHGPLPPGAEDGYDPNVKFEDGSIVSRTDQDKCRTKMMTREASPPGMLRIYTDGSSLNNGQLGARAGVGVYFGPSDPKYVNPTPSSSPPPPPPTQHLYTMDWALRNPDSVSRKRKLTNWRYRNVSEALKGSKQTNQRAELTAILRALDVAPRHREVTIYTDSRYAIDCVTNWYKGWEVNGWVNSRGKPVENRDLVQEVRERIVEREELQKATYFVWVKGHAGDVGNIAADRLANEGALRGVRESVDGSGDGSGSENVDDEEDIEESEDRSEDDEDEDGLEGESEEVKESYRLMKKSMME